MADPLGSGIESVLFGSVVLACGLLLIAFLLRSVRISALSNPQQKKTAARQPRPRAVVRRVHASDAAPVPSRPFHRVYVDDARISL
jgi:hypothetical protein